jgi:hypothetical protein
LAVSWIVGEVCGKEKAIGVFFMEKDSHYQLRQPKAFWVASFEEQANDGS